MQANRRARLLTVLDTTTRIEDVAVTLTKKGFWLLIDPHVNVTLFVRSTFCGFRGDWTTNMNEMIQDLEKHNPLTDVRTYAESGNDTMIAFSFYLREFKGELQDIPSQIDVCDLRRRMVEGC